MIRFLFVFFFSFSCLFGAEKSIHIQGVVLLDDSENLIHSGFEHYKGVHFEHLKPPGNLKTLTRQLNDSLIGQPLDQSLVLEGKNLITEYYKSNGFPLTIVSIPEQKVSDGVLQYVVTEGRVGKISYSGNKWTPTSQLSKSMRQKHDQPLDVNLIEQDLIWLNRNPFRQTSIILSPGDEEGTTDIQFASEDDFPYRLYVGGDNTGYDATGKGRLFVGVNFGNLFHLDQRLSYQYTVSTKWGNFYAHTGQYIVPLPWRHILELYGGYSGIHAKMPIKQMSSSGNAWQASMRYLIPLRPKGAYSHEFRCGVDYKQTNVNLVFDAIPILGDQTVITQAMLGYNGALQHDIVDTSFEFQWFVSPGDIFPNQSSKDYGSLRPKAKSFYTYMRASLIPVFRLPKQFSAVIRSEFQVASQNLLSSEQFGLGGLYTVRGYDERIINTDNAFLLTGELRFPPARVFTKKSNSKTIEILQFLAFLDYGFGTNHDALPEARNYLYLLSTGLGMRYRYSYHVNARVDWGIPIHRHIQKNVTQKGGHFNFSLIFSY